MRDYTVEAYRQYILAIKNNGLKFMTYKQFMSEDQSLMDNFCLVRHDVDRKPKNALFMARLESELDIQSTYYFRMPYTFDKVIISEIEHLGHEIGYHYESLSESSGNFEKAFINFTHNLEQLRSVANVSTIAMHGRPLKPYDNRDLWRDKTYHHKLQDELNILGEVYLDIDYTNIAYINDTGRNWTSGKSNLRDKVNSEISVDFNSMDELLSYFKDKPHRKMVFQVHPERWAYNNVDYVQQYIMDFTINTVKFGLSLLGR